MMMNKLNSFSKLDSKVVLAAKENYGTPIYLYDESLIVERCKATLAMPNAYGIGVRYAMKANSGKSLLRIISGQGLMIDASSLNEAKRAHLAGIPLKDIFLTTQEIPDGKERKDLEEMMLKGLKYNVCSMEQLHRIGEFAKDNKIDLSIRIHPGVGSGESASRNTGDKYSCFGVHLSDVDQALRYAEERSLQFTEVHVHIGSGGDPEVWRQNIDLELGIIEKYFPDCHTVSFGGGLKEGRMPGEIFADIQALGEYAKQQIEKFYEKNGRKLKMEIEPGTYIVANSGYAVTTVVDKKQTGADGFNFIIVDGGMEINARPLIYGSRHPFYIVSKTGELLSSDYDAAAMENSDYEAIVVGRCCESGDSQSLDSDHNILTRTMAEPEIGDILVIGGAGAYCSSMTPFNYNSHTQIPEVLFTKSGELKLIRKGQTLEQIVENEL
jgi:diaminopimelate decarboxylase